MLQAPHPINPTLLLHPGVPASMLSVVLHSASIHQIGLRSDVVVNVSLASDHVPSC